MEIKVIGRTGCSRCEMVKNLFKNKGISYTYQLLDDLNNEDKDKFIEQAQSKGLMNLPLIIKNDEVVDLDEMIQTIKNLK